MATKKASSKAAASSSSNDMSGMWKWLYVALMTKQKMFRMMMKWLIR